MDDLERLTITLPADLVADRRVAVEAGDYGSTNDVVDLALRDWLTRRVARHREFASLMADIDAGLEDAAAGRVKPFDKARIRERGQTLSTARSPSA